MIKNTLPNKSKNPASLKKFLRQLESFSTNVHVVGEDFLRVFYKVFYLRFCVSRIGEKIQYAKKFWNF